ncbi:G-type lectin S-receptor-like serine/threonine-protein kinase B120 isoform X2 [Apium graveolens]|uniref:G-type lectin S-receptor-like serine/threonine-protein kinase B120 isoform X2 n=1 Tax=Apium graveolens TaxID=4045 RepID=UPI003D7AE97A
MQLLEKMVSARRPSSFQQLKILIFLFIFYNLKVSFGLDTLSTGRPLYENEILISKVGKFELGFFSPGSSNNSYVGIWYNYKYIQDREIVWVANRETPIRKNSNPRLVLDADGSLIIFSDLNETIWALNISAGLSSVPKKGIIHDGGNFVLSDERTVIWQSFDYPTDTWLPGGKLGIDGSLINKEQQLTSWKDWDDPAPGNFSVGIDPGKSPELFMWMNQSQIVWRSGAWKGNTFDNFPSSLSNGLMYFSHFTSNQSNYFTLNISTSTTFRYTITYDGELRQWKGKLAEGSLWEVLSSYPSDTCNMFGLCGPNSFCKNKSSPPCICYKGFEPRFMEEWQSANWSGGCISTKPLQCFNEFNPVSGISMPINSRSLNLESSQICESACLGNCSCTAYAYNGGRCSLWSDDLLGSRVTDNSQEDLFVRSSEGRLARDKSKSKDSNIPIAVFIAIPLLIIVSLTCLFWRIWSKKHMKQEVGESNEDLLYLNLEISGTQYTDSNDIDADSTLGREKKVFNLPQFSFSSITAATNNFSPENKLGEGGFGPVYKGKLFDGNLVAVKRLSKRSGQGLEELRNETVLIAKLQHINLVRILGCCIDQDEKILIYEYMPNKSLDCFIFDPSKQVLLDWSKRVQIIEGIAQGLLYLHQHSRLRIVHRDLKASNILLDHEMIPKISDFGMARIFGGLQANTNRIMGTYGYMSPEYAMEGLFSIKSDVFAFGVLLLEILRGKKSTGFYHSDCLSLLGYAWELWRTDRALELIDSTLELPTSFLTLRYIHVGLLCVQESPADRPTMCDVLAMFGNELFKLVSPKRPAFTSGGSVSSGIDKAGHCSVDNILTVSVMDGR